MENKISSELFKRAKEVMPGGVNSPVRAFRSVGCDPLFIKKADGSKIYDEDGHEFIDYICSWGPMILGHNHPVIRKAVEEAVQNGLSYGAPNQNEVLIGELIKEMVPNIEMIRMVNSGTEAVMSAIRVARGFTGRNKVIKFAGCYHGHSDSMLVKAGSGLLTEGVPDSLGVPKHATEDTLTADYNNIESVKSLFDNNRGEIAAVIIEPVAANMGVVMPEESFLKDLRALCTENGALFIFDEVITGFRLAKGGAQEYFGIKADLVTFGKIIGAGMPVGAYGGRRDVMEYVSPLGGVYQAGTLSGNPVAMAAGLAQLRMLNEHPEIYSRINKSGKILAEGFRKIAEKYDAPVTVNRAGSLLSVFFTDKMVKNYNDARCSNTDTFREYFRVMEEEGIYIAPSQFEAMFVSYAHSSEDIEKTLDAAEKAFKKIYGGK